MLRAYFQLPATIWLLALGTLINRAGAVVLPFLTLYLSEHLNLGIPFATLVMSLCGAGAVCGSLLGGVAADRIGRKPTMVFALLAGAASLMALSAFRQEAAIAVGAFVYMLVSDLYRPAMQAVVADTVSAEARPHAFGLIYVAINLGFAIGPVVGGLLVEKSFNLLFYLNAGAFAIFGVFIAVLIPETLSHSPRTPTIAGESPPPPARSAVRQIAGDRTFLLFCIATFLVSFAFMQFNTTLPLYLKTLGISPASYGKIIAVNGLLIVLFQIPLTKLTADFDRGLVLALGATLTALGFAMNLWALAAWQFMVAVGVWTLGEMLGASFNATIVSGLAPPAMRARYMGAFSLSFQGAVMAAAPIGGAVFQKFGPNWVWIVAAAAPAVAALIFTYLRGAIARRMIADSHRL
jgi:MFS family permease